MGKAHRSGCHQGLRQPRRLHDATEGGRRYDRSRGEGSRSEGQATLVLSFGFLRCCCCADSHLLLTALSVTFATKQTSQSTDEGIEMATATTMRAVQVPRAGGSFQLVERKLPKPGLGEVRVRVQACGVCHSDSIAKEGLFPGIPYAWSVSRHMRRPVFEHRASS